MQNRTVDMTKSAQTQPDYYGHAFQRYCDIFTKLIHYIVHRSHYPFLSTYREQKVTVGWRLSYMQTSQDLNRSSQI